MEKGRKKVVNNDTQVFQIQKVGKLLVKQNSVPCPKGTIVTVNDDPIFVQRLQAGNPPIFFSGNVLRLSNKKYYILEKYVQDNKQLSLEGVVEGYQFIKDYEVKYKNYSLGPNAPVLSKVFKKGMVVQGFPTKGDNTPNGIIIGTPPALETTTEGKIPLNMPGEVVIRIPLSVLQRTKLGDAIQQQGGVIGEPHTDMQQKTDEQGQLIKDIKNRMMNIQLFSLVVGIVTGFIVGHFIIKNK